MSMIIEWLDSLAKTTMMPDVMNCRFKANGTVYEGFIAEYNENGILFQPNGSGRVRWGSSKHSRWFPFIHIYDLQIGSIKEIFPEDWNLVKRMRKE